MQFDFTQEFDRLGTQIIRELMNSVVKNVGLDEVPYSRPEVSTLSQRKVRRNKSVSILRMFVTGQFARGAFNYLANPMSLKVFVNDTTHPSGKKFTELLAWNSRNQTEYKGTNPRVKNPPLIFPTNEEEIRKGFQKQLEQGKKEIDRTASIQIKDALKMKLKATISL
jgi:hypothetical protein